MRVKEISVTYARTFNLGNYENARFETTITADVEEEGAHAATAALWQLAKDTIKAQALPVIKKREEDVAAIRASLPAGVLE